METNLRTTLVLHAVPHAMSNHCFTPQDGGFDCMLALPNVTVAPFSSVDIYLFLRNYDDLCGVQCAFAWPLEWQLNYWWPGSLGGCQSQQIVAAAPAAPGGTTSGTLAAAFDRVTGGYLTPVGLMSFEVGPDGCLAIVESSYPFGTHVVDPGGAVAPVAEIGRGKICAGPGGVDACVIAGPVAVSSWGRIKSAYRR